METTLTDGSPVPEDRSHTEIDPISGMQKGYVVLSEKERAKGYVRPLRDSYVHVGMPAPVHPLVDIPEYDQEMAKKYHYVKYELYSEEYQKESGCVGRYWTQEDLDRVNAGCGMSTKMGLALAETYAVKPTFYGGTFCASCRQHFPVGKYGEFVWEGTDIRVGT